jgi:hypothetical protein
MIKEPIDYSVKTAKEWFDEGRWTAFLMSVPLGKAKGYPCGDANKLMSIRVTASTLNNNPDCDRRFKVTADFDTKVITITATKKQDHD